MEKSIRAQKIDQIKQLFRTLITETFGDLTLYAFLGGSLAFNIDKKNSDIDCVVVLKDKAYQDIEIKNKIKRFVRGYLKIHQICGYTPDLNFPGDIISESQKEEALGGLGFVSEGSVKTFLVIKEKDWDRQNIDYRVWLTEIAFDSNMFVTGNLTLFRKDSMQAMDTILKFILFLSNGQKIDPENVCNEIFKKGKPFLGLSDLYRPVFESRLIEKLKLSFNHLETSGLVNKSGTYFQINFPLIKVWEADILAKSKRKRSSYLISWQETRNYMRLLENE